jgi:response regulator RpfG family c-di-GMP phosphodiesterase
MSRILVVEDQSDMRYMLSSTLSSQGHQVVEARNGEEALWRLHQQRPDVVISDVLMPVMDGFELCRRLRDDPDYRDLPFIFCSGNFTHSEERGFALELGANRYIEKPVDPRVLVQEVRALIERQESPSSQEPGHDFWERHRSIVLGKLQQKGTELEVANGELRTGENRLRQAMMATVQTIDRIVEYRDPYTSGHQHRVGHLAAAIGREIGLGDHRIQGLLFGGYVHDVGKIFAPAEILTRPGRLNDMELAIVRAHSRIGHDILQGVDFPWPVAQMALQHHERMSAAATRTASAASRSCSRPA